MPSDLPVEQPIRFKLTINLIHADELARADEEIEQRCGLLAKAFILRASAMACSWSFVPRTSLV